MLAVKAVRRLLTTEEKRQELDNILEILSSGGVETAEDKAMIEEELEVHTHTLTVLTYTVPHSHSHRHAHFQRLIEG